MFAPHPEPVLQDNYVWMIEGDNSTVWIVDPGEALPVLRVLEKGKWQPEGILLTHHHGDHAGGIPGILTCYADLPVYASAQSPHDFVSHRLNEGDEIQAGRSKLRVLAIPGHTLDHLAFYSEKEAALFCGDTLFSAGCGRIFEGTISMMFATLGKIANLPDATRIYCGHEYTRKNLLFAQHVEPENVMIKEKMRACAEQPVTLPSVLGDEKKFNPFLRCHLSSVQRRVEKLFGEKCIKCIADPQKTFGLLRKWKDSL